MRARMTPNEIVVDAIAAKKEPAKKIPTSKVESVEVVPEKKKRGKNNYLNNKDMLAQVVLSKQQGRMTNELSKMMMLLADRYGRHPWFMGYTYIDDMKASALLTVVRFWDRFDETKYSNAFAYFTQMIKRAFYQYKIQEKKQRTIRDLLLVDQGENPSYTFTEEYDAENASFQRMDGHDMVSPVKLIDMVSDEYIDPNDPVEAVVEEEE